MSGVTGIELGPNYCVLVRGGRPGSHRTVSAAPGSCRLGVARRFARAGRLAPRGPSALRPVRAARALSPGAPSRADARPPLVEAGFEIGSVLSPAQALARVVRTRQVGAPAGTAVAALSLNSHGGAIAIVSGTEVIHSRVFEWPLGTPFTKRRALVPSCSIATCSFRRSRRSSQHDIDLVRPAYGVTVTSIVACGNLPNLRSLAMLLIEEMDIEVETLDSAELLDPSVAPGTLADTVASLQLAAAVASPGENRVPVHADIEPAQTRAHSIRRGPRPNASGQVLVSRAWRHSSRSRSAQAGRSCRFTVGPARPIFPDGIDQWLPRPRRMARTGTACRSRVPKPPRDATMRARSGVPKRLRLSPRLATATHLPSGPRPALESRSGHPRLVLRCRQSMAS